MNQPSAGRRFPYKLLAATTVSTALALVWSLWSSYDDHRTLVAMKTRHLRCEQLEGRIRHLDEVLTMSARMAAATSDLRWETRYRRYEPQLDAAIKEAVKLAPESINSASAAQTDAANVALVNMENEAFALVRAGKADDAKSVLFGAEYERQKQVYADGLEAFIRQAAANSQWEVLQRLAHQLKGAGGSYGYACLTDVARELESCAKPQDAKAAMLSLNTLTRLCEQVQAGRKADAASRDARNA